MIKHNLILKGSSARGKQISAFLLKDLLDVIIDGTKGALRLRAEGRSTARGSDPGWLNQAGDFDLIGFQSGSTVIEIECKPLSEAAPDKFAQLAIFKKIDPSLSAFDLFQESLSDAVDGRADSDLYDDNLLQCYSRLNSVFEKGIESFSITGKDNKQTAKLLVNASHMECIGRLRGQIPPNQQIKITGRLDTIRHSDRMFELVLKSGDMIRGVATEQDANELKNLFGKDVLVSGTAVFRPSSSLLRIEASSIEPAHGNVALWSKSPKARKSKLDTHDLRKPQGPQSGLNRIWGKWPGTETDEQLERVM